MLTSWRKVIWTALVMIWGARGPALTGGLMFSKDICCDWATALSALSALVKWSPPGISDNSFIFLGGRVTPGYFHGPLGYPRVPLGLLPIPPITNQNPFFPEFFFRGWGDVWTYLRVSIQTRKSFIIIKSC